ncbi:MAG: hypothetical protein ACK5SX_08505 [Sandaracinobacter sp.]
MHKWMLTVALALVAAPALAVPTEIHVRVLSQGAKFIGTSMGGVELILRDVHTGEPLAGGLVQGSTGDTARIMGGAPRATPLSTPDSAVWKGVIDIPVPRLIEVVARGPLAQPQAMVSVSSQRWVIPGRGVTIGDGWLLELPGLVVDAVEPAAHEQLARGTTARRLAVNVSMLCGCPITPGGMWDANGFDVRASVRAPDGAVREVKLGYGGRTGLFTADLPLGAPGAYVLTVTAFDEKTGATGVDRTSFLLP